MPSIHLNFINFVSLLDHTNENTNHISNHCLFGRLILYTITICWRALKIFGQ